MSEPFCGFGSQDVRNSEELLSVKIEHSISIELADEIDRIQSKIEGGDSQVPIDTQELDNNNQTTDIVNGSDEKHSLVAEILDKMVSIAENHSNLKIDDAIDKGECNPQLNDDAETKLFLSFC